MGTLIVNQYLNKLWTPAEIATELWLDSQDSNSFVLDGLSVNEWGDKSGNNRTLLAGDLASKRPTLLSGGINNNQCVSFDGVDDYMAVESTHNTKTLFVVFKILDVVTQLQNIITTQVDGTQPYMYIQVDATTLKVYGGSYADAKLGLVPGETILIQYTKDVDKKAYIDGSLVLSEAKGNTTIKNGFIIGLVPDFGAFPEMYMGEIVALDSEPNDILRQKIEGYLAYKWGLTTNLPVTHPYKNTPPYV